MNKIDLPTLPHDTVEISDRLVSIGERLGVTAMAVKGIAAENQDESAYAISNLIFEVREELEDISMNICSSVVAMRK